MKNKTLIFGYGSLINEASLKKTLPKAKIIGVGILKGYKRVFETKSSNRKSTKNKSISVLNITPDKLSYLNGVIIQIKLNDKKDLGERESAYENKEVEISTKNGIIKTLVFIDNSEIKQNFLYGDSTQENYLKICLNGARSHGQKFYNEFLKTTFIKNKNLTETKPLA